MDSRQLHFATCIADPEIKKHCLGILPSDKLPSNQRLGCIIVNEDTHGGPGTHWVALLTLPNNQTEYYDSYGREPLVKGIQRFLQGRDVRCSGRMVQSPFSTTCGQHCLYYLFHRCRGVSLPKIVDSYKQEQQLNDDMVCDFVKAKFQLDTMPSDLSMVWEQVSKALQSI